MWTSDYVQFARLISELAAAGAFTDEMLTSLHAVMHPEHLAELRERADALWNEVQQHSNPTAWIVATFGWEAMRSTTDD